MTPEERKRFGAVFTRRKDATKLAASLPKSKLKTGTIMDACCGEGELIVAVVKRMLKLGLEPKDIARRIHGVDIVPAHIATTIKRLETLLGSQPILRKNFVVKDIFSSDS